MGKLPGQVVEKFWEVMTKPGGIGEIEQMIVNPVVGGSVMVQVLPDVLPGQNTEKLSEVMTKPDGIGETWQMIVNPVVGGAVIVQVLLLPPGQDSEVP